MIKLLICQLLSRLLDPTIRSLAKPDDKSIESNIFVGHVPSLIEYYKCGNPSDFSVNLYLAHSSSYLELGLPNTSDPIQRFKPLGSEIIIIWR